MPHSPAARRYARALFELSQEQGRLDAVQADLAEIRKHTDAGGALAPLLDPRALAAERRVSAWRELLQNRADPLTLRFVLFLVHKGRGTLLASIIRDFEEYCHEARGIQPVEIISARPLPEDQIRRITERMAARLNKTLQPTVRVDNALLGGFQVRVRDTIYDFSLNHQLDNLHRTMLNA
ncbi:MAG TPA: ATP synthase F1 subunit delta [Kiritimatiellia bacterium]|nr:ATP synthase F1 subunit delta [Kiritimatiellia bacterium]